MLKKAGETIREIARDLTRSPSTVLRELRRNSGDNELGYLPDRAHKKAKKRKTNHGKKLDKYSKMKEYIINRLKNKWSPEMIAGRMKLMDSPFMVCAETIYQWVYSNEGKKLRLFSYLMKGRSSRQGIFGRKKHKILLPDRTSIHERPDQINDRKEVGHFEADLTFFKARSENLGVIIERKSRFVKLIKNRSKKSTEVIQGMFNALANFPKDLIKSLTFDNGLEFARHTLLKHHLGMKTYFCDPYSPWQKGQVEQTHVMIHRYIKKKESLKNYSDQDVQDIEEQMNNLPRKCLGPY